MGVVVPSGLVEVIVDVSQAVPEGEQGLSIGSFDRAVLLVSVEQLKCMLFMTGGTDEPADEPESGDGAEAGCSAICSGMNEPEFAIGVPGMLRPLFGNHNPGV